MRGTMTGKILEAHLVEGRLLPGEEVALGIDQTLLQDATGTMACMEFEALGLGEVKVDLAVQYVDHNMLQFDHRNADDHLFLQTFAARHGIRFSRAGWRSRSRWPGSRSGCPSRWSSGCTWTVSCHPGSPPRT